MKKIIFMLCLLNCILGFSSKRSMMDFMRSHNRNLSFEESSFIYDMTMHYAGVYKVDPVLVFSVMKTESHFRHSTVSSAGALGLMQLMPFNFKEFGVNNSIEGNIKGGIMHLRRDLDRTGNTVKALVCYNAGCSRREKDRWLSIKETTDYISKINRIYPVIKKILFDNSKGAYSQKNQNMGNSESGKENEESIAENKKVRRLKIVREQLN